MVVLFLSGNCLSSLYSAPVFRRGWLCGQNARNYVFLWPGKAARDFRAEIGSRWTSAKRESYGWRKQRCTGVREQRKSSANAARPKKANFDGRLHAHLQAQTHRMTSIAPQRTNTPPDALPPDLLRLLATMPDLAVALSGGLDSRFLTHAALLAGCCVTALHITGPHMPPRETEEARRWATARGATFTAVPLDPLTIPAIAAGDRDRCYHCKHAAFTALLAKTAPLPLCDGTNADDLTAHRPGLRALRELAVRSPLAEAGLSKTDIRTLAARTGMDRPDQAARPCLLTRLAYGMPPHAAILARLAAAEGELEDLGLWDFRLRLAPNSPPRLQLGPAHAALSPARRDALRPVLARHGFGDAAIDADGPVSGYFDR
ncbi:hypothetical protein DA2_1692 [Desulfovibrio sp. A2]|nr:hypothetical protein DA2_1692 [Desulfovibrio sp. A2]